MEKNVSARLAPLPGMKIGILETNGHQYYKNCEQMKRCHPCAGAACTKVKDGIIILDEDFIVKAAESSKLVPNTEQSKCYNELIE